MARAMGTNAYGKEPRRGERTLSRGFTHRRARRAFLRPYGAGVSLGRSHRAYALGYFLAPLTVLRTTHAQDWHDAKNSASKRRRGLKAPAPPRAKGRNMRRGARTRLTTSETPRESRSQSSGNFHRRLCRHFGWALRRV